MSSSSTCLGPSSVFLSLSFLYSLRTFSDSCIYPSLHVCVIEWVLWWGSTQQACRLGSVNNETNEHQPKWAFNGLRLPAATREEWSIGSWGGGRGQKDGARRGWRRVRSCRHDEKNIEDQITVFLDYTHLWLHHLFLTCSIYFNQFTVAF